LAPCLRSIPPRQAPSLALPRRTGRGDKRAHRRTCERTASEGWIGRVILDATSSGVLIYSLMPTESELAKAVRWVTLPLWLPVHLFLAATDLRLLPHERRLRRQMENSGRLASPSVLHSGGTIIDDRPTPNWGVGRLWWTPDDVLAEAPVPPPTNEEMQSAPWHEEFVWHSFDRWVWERYLNPSHGTALLLQAWRVEKLLRKIRSEHRACRIVSTYSSGKDFENFRPLSLRESSDVE
jgi:hypothetical protein